jgi:hypothetical protein
MSGDNMVRVDLLYGVAALRRECYAVTGISSPQLGRPDPVAQCGYCGRYSSVLGNCHGCGAPNAPVHRADD